MKRGAEDGYWPERRLHVAELASHLALLHKEAAASLEKLHVVAMTSEADDGTNDLGYRTQIIAEVNRYAQAIQALCPMPTKAAGGKFEP